MHGNLQENFKKELQDYYELGEKKPDTSWHVDLIGSFEKTDRMQILPVNKEILVTFLAAVILPLLPVIAQEIPLKELFVALASKFLG